MSTTATPTPTRSIAPPPPATGALPIHPRRPGWRAGAAAALVAFATAELRAGRSPHRDVCSLAELGHGEMDRGVVAAEEIDRRLADVLAGHVDELLLRRARTAVSDAPEPGAALLDDEHADELVEPLFAALDLVAVSGRPHPGEWVASSVDVLPCGVHGYEADPLDCLRRSVREHLTRVVEDGATNGPELGLLTQQVRSAARSRQTGDTVLATLWTGVATLAAWQAYTASR